jgi:TP901 family phage tail tape measure protein
VKQLKKFEPPPMHVKLVIDKQGNAKSVIDQKAVVKEAEKTGAKAGEAIVTGVKKETKALPSAVGDSAKKAGETIKREIVKPIQKVDEDIAKAVDPSKQQGRIKAAAQRMGQAIREAVGREADKAGDEAGNKIAKGIEKAKGAVSKAERSLADARLAAGNIESRIRQQEERVQQLREATARGLRNVASEEKIYQDMRANASQHTADQIQAQERKLQTMQTAQQNRNVRLNAAEESQSRLLNSRESSTNRTANAVDNLGAKEAALATAMSLQNDPMQQTNNKLKQGGMLAGGMMAGLIPLGKQLLVTSGLFTGALGLAGGITYTMRTGNEFTDTINKMQGVLGRTSGQMGDITAKARELGRDFSLPATSANDAATSMFELTKAGFSAQQAMDAARGSLQLSAAAGISAADASYITGTALNAFGLQATDATKITDLLANAANLFPGEMQDFGYSLSQGGAVAKSFGISIEDTTTALGFLAKAGIKSSDAGTLIKTMLLSLTDQGKPAQGAIHDLGLELYDQNHNFKGLEYVYKRLNQASKEMTQEQYQAATATLFGTDAARFAGIAAGESAPNWDEFRDKIDKTGTAAEVANARMQGLPGALERMKNAGQELALTIYDMVKGPLTAVVNAVAKVVLAFAGWLQGPFINFIRKYKEEIIGVGIVLGTYVTVLAAIKIATMAWTAVQWLLNAALDANPIGLVVLAIAALVAGVIYAYKHFDWFKNAVDATWSFIKTAFQAALPVIKAVWDGIATGALWLWNNALKPAFEWIANTGWPLLKTAFAAGWTAIKVVFDAFKTAALFLWNNALKPAFDWIKAGWTLVWQAMQVGWRVGQVVWEAVKAAAFVLWHGVFEPVFQGIMDVVRPVWGFLKQAFEGWKLAFQAVGDAAMWLWHNIFEPVWQGIQTGWQTLMDFLKPVWDWFKSGLEGIGNIATKIADGIKSAWSGIQEVFKVPLHALGNFLAGIPSEILGVHVDAIESVNNWGRSLQGLAIGGIIQGPGTSTSDSILGVNSRNVPTVRVSNGEGVVPANRLDTPIGQMLFAMLLGAVPGLATGGRIGQWMSQADSAGYQMGGFSMGAFDCSGLVSAMVNVSMGREWNQGPSGGSARTATAGEAAWLSSQGFQKGSGGAGTLRVGFKNGGAGGGHTAGTLPDGTNFESTSGGVRFGSEASGASDFPEQWFLPRNGPEDPGAGGIPASALGASSGAFSSGGVYGGGAGGKLSSSASGSTMGGVEYDSKKIREATDRVSDRENQLAAAQQRLDEQLAKGDAKESTITNARNQVDKFQRELDQAKSDLETAKQGEYKEGKGSGKGATGKQDDWSSVGGMIFSGFLEEMGFDGSVFKNLLDTPNVKSAMAGLNWGLGMLFPGQDSAGGGNAPQDLGLGGGGGGILGAGAEVLAGVGEQAGINFPEQATAPPGAPGPGNAPVIDMSGSQFGWDPVRTMDAVDEKTAAVNRRYPQVGPG